MPVDGKSAASVGIGALFLYAGIKGFSVLKATQNVIQGNSANVGQDSASLYNPAPNTPSQNAQVNGNTQGGTPSSNRALGQVMAAAMGWTGSQFTCLDALWTRESGWNQYAKNPSSGAYGIPQSLPESKLPAAGQESGGSNPQAQIQWGLDYIRSTYGDPCSAEAHENANGWY